MSYRLLDKKTTSIFLLAVIMTASIAVPASAKITLSSLRRDWNHKVSQIQRVRQDLRETKKKEKTAAYQLAYAQKRLQYTRNGLMDIRSQLRRTRTHLSITQAELMRVQRRLEVRNKLLSRRLVDTYKYGDVSYLGVLFGASDFADLISRGYMVRKVLGTDIDLIESINEDKQEVEDRKAALAEQEQKRSALEHRQRSLTQAAHAQTKDCASILKDIEKDRAKQEEMLAELQADSNSIAAMMRKFRSTPAGQKMDKQPWHGRFMKPYPGRITCPFGMRIHPIFHTRRMHTGTDIAAPWGATVVAPGSGTVTSAGWRPAYGYTVTIYHGNGVSTFCGHNSSLLVHAGQTVKQGQPIARAGSTGLSTGPHVHFEVIRNGHAVAPW